MFKIYHLTSQAILLKIEKINLCRIAMAVKNISVSNQCFMRYTASMSSSQISHLNSGKLRKLAQKCTTLQKQQFSIE